MKMHCLRHKENGFLFPYNAALAEESHLEDVGEVDVPLAQAEPAVELMAPEAPVEGADPAATVAERPDQVEAIVEFATEVEAEFDEHAEEMERREAQQRVLMDQTGGEPEIPGDTKKAKRSKK